MLLEATLSTALKRFVFYSLFSSLLEETTYCLLDMAKRIPFKFCLFTNSGQDKDIRRFDIKLDVVGNLTYQYLIDELENVYPLLYNQPSSLHYIGKQTFFAAFTKSLFRIVFLLLLFSI